MKAALICALVYSSAFAQQNGKLQIHFIDVGQGDASFVISPKGETVLIDNGPPGGADEIVSYLEQLGVTKIDYHITSHFHNDHIGNTTRVFTEFPLQKTAFDRGGTYKSKAFKALTDMFGTQRKTASPGGSLILDNSDPDKVRIDFVASNGDGIPTENENDASLVCALHFGSFDDLSGETTGHYKDIESSVARKVSQVEVYKANHHGSQHSSNLNWLGAIRPKIAVISCGDGNSYGHPTQGCMDRLHQFNVKSYWTERGNGAPPAPSEDKIAGNTIVEVAPGSTQFRVIYAGANVDTYDDWEPGLAPGQLKFSWSSSAHIYHHSNCKFVKNISPWNLQSGNAPPSGMQLHAGCPK